MNTPLKQRLSIEEYTKGILQGDRVVLGKAITLMESNLEADKHLASALIEKIIDNTGHSIRVGITGSPGVGKSTFIESLGKHLTDLDNKVAVLTIDPSSAITKGSILGDKTRMEMLSKNTKAFIRPTPSGTKLGGVANKTREAMLLCEAAGYNIIIVETVGVGQSEVDVKSMTDFFLLLMLAGAGDELQGMKKGIMEMVDAIVITKADGDNVEQANKAQAEFQQALHLFAAQPSGWEPKVLKCSAQTGAGIEEVWQMMLKYKSQTERSDFFKTNRHKQSIDWATEYFAQILEEDVQRLVNRNEIIKPLQDRIKNHQISPRNVAYQILAAYHKAIRDNKP